MIAAESTQRNQPDPVTLSARRTGRESAFFLDARQQETAGLSHAATFRALYPRSADVADDEGVSADDTAAAFFRESYERRTDLDDWARACATRAEAVHSADVERASESPRRPLPARSLV